MTVSDLAERVRSVIVSYPDWPKPGVTFADLSLVYADPDLRRELTAHFSTIVVNHGIEVVAAVESRGYLLGMSIADDLGLPFIQVRKAGKLPGDCVKTAYSLEYGMAEVEVQLSAFRDGARVLLVDDVLATGGTMKAARELVEMAKAEVVSVVVIGEIGALHGRDLLSGLTVNALLKL